MKQVKEISPYMIVEENNLFGITDSEGNLVVPCEMVVILGFDIHMTGESLWDECGLVELRKEHRLGFFTNKGLYIEPQYDDVMYTDGAIEVKKGSNYGLYKYPYDSFYEIPGHESTLWRDNYNVDLREKVFYKIDGKWIKNIYADNAEDTKLYFRKEISEAVSFDIAERHYLDDSSYEGVYIFRKENKAAIFIVDEEYGLNDGTFKCEDTDPFRYDSLNLYFTKERGGAYALVSENKLWSVLKVFRLPKPGIEVVCSGFENYKDAIDYAGIKDEFEDLK